MCIPLSAEDRVEASMINGSESCVLAQEKSRKLKFQAQGSFSKKVMHSHSGKFL